MQIDKSQIIELLKSRGDHDQAAQAESELPDKVDLDTDAELLQRFDLDPEELRDEFEGQSPAIG